MFYNLITYASSNNQNNNNESANIYINKLLDIKNDNSQSGAFLSHEFFKFLDEDSKSLKILFADLQTSKRTNIFWDILTNNYYFAKQFWKFLNKRKLKKETVKQYPYILGVPPVRQYEQTSTTKVQLFLNICLEDYFENLFKSISQFNEYNSRIFWNFLNKDINWETFCQTIAQSGTDKFFINFFKSLYESKVQENFWIVLTNKFKPIEKKHQHDQNTKTNNINNESQTITHNYTTQQTTSNGFTHSISTDVVNLNTNHQEEHDPADDYHKNKTEIFKYELSKNNKLDILINCFSKDDKYCQQAGLDFCKAMNDYDFFSDMNLSSNQLEELYKLSYIPIEILDKIKSNDKKNRFIFWLIIIIIIAVIGLLIYFNRDKFSKLS